MKNQKKRLFQGRLIIVNNKMYTAPHFQSLQDA